MAKVIVGMSGGVDSAVCAYLLKKQGYEVIGVTLRSWVASNGDEGRCCEIDDARRVANGLGIRYHVQNCLSEFEEHVTTPFINDYINGLTPNPCIECNRYVKWERLLYMAKVFQADYVATGHYASVVKLDNGRYTVKMAEHAEKDQTYMLYKLTQEQLSMTLMPLGGYTKADVRKIAEEAGIAVADKPDSQEICFVPDGSYADYIKENADGEIPGEGNFVDEEGNILGRHKGIINYTVGQRKGLGIALGHPAFICRIDKDRNEIVIGKEDSLYKKEVYLRECNYLSIPEPGSGDKIRCEAKIRYHHSAKPAMLEVIDYGHARLVFDEPVKGPAPGQSSVFYDENGCVIGGGIIEND